MGRWKGEQILYIIKQIEIRKIKYTIDMDGSDQIRSDQITSDRQMV